MGVTNGRPWKIVPEEQWYDDELSNYDFATGGQADGTDGAYSHLTQMLWDESLGLGCAQSLNKRNDKVSTFIVCRYSPRGNIKGKFDEHVHELR